MSRHSFQIKKTGIENPITVIVGYDRPLKETFFQVALNDEEDTIIDNMFANTLPDALVQANISEEDVAKVVEHLNSQKILFQIAVEEAACDEHVRLMIAVELSSPEQGDDSEELKEIFEQSGLFKDFNRVVQYKELVLQ